MDGAFLSSQMASKVVQASKKLREVVRRTHKIDLIFKYQLTGDGESLLNPDLVEIFDILLGSFEDTQCWMVTSGVNPRSPDEEKRLRTILSRPYANRLDFDLSFNLFQRGFPKRFLRTARILFENGIEKIGIKVCQTDMATNKALWKLFNIVTNYFIKWSREIDPLISLEEAFTHLEFGSNIQEMIMDLVPPVRKMKETSAQKRRRINNSLKKARVPSSHDLNMLSYIFNTNFNQTFQFPTKYGYRKIRIQPMFMLKRGRGRALPNLLWKYGQPKHPCCYALDMKESVAFHLSAEGHYYPTCECPKSEWLRLGDVDDNLVLIWNRWKDLRDVFSGHIIQDNRMYSDACDHCALVASKPEIQEILKNKYL